MKKRKLLQLLHSLRRRDLGGSSGADYLFPLSILPIIVMIGHPAKKIIGLGANGNSI
jgi:hypothetical protein